MKLFWLRLVLLVGSVFGFYSERANEDFGASEVTGCLPRKLGPEERCDITTNCRYGGKCRKVADVQRHGTSVRFVMPQGEYLDSSNETEQAVDGEMSMLERMRDNGYSFGPEECVCDFTCGEDYQSIGESAVCGSNGRTYPTECHLKRDACRCQTSIEVTELGPCEGDVNMEVDVSSTPAPSKFIVGSCMSGCNYGATCEGTTGNCVCNIECSAQRVSHICGRDQRTYTNFCHVKRSQCRYQKGIDILYAGACETGARVDGRLRRESRERRRGRGRRPSSSCDNTDCDVEVEDPVCGTDDISYPNECLLRIASCVKRRRIRVKHKKYCDHSSDDVPTVVEASRPILTATESPVDKDDSCHGILCLHGGVCIKHEEYEFICSCDAICDEVTPIPTKAPPPEVDIIELDMEKGIKSAWAEMPNEYRTGRDRRRRRKHRNSHGRRSRDRSRRSVEGPRDLIYEVLCGTDNKTYTNECHLRKEACNRQTGITISHRGACVKPALLTTTTRTSGSTEVKTTVSSAVEIRDEIIDSSILDTIDVGDFDDDENPRPHHTSRSERKNERRRNRNGRIESPEPAKRNPENSGRRENTTESALDGKQVVETREETVDSQILNNFGFDFASDSDSNVDNVDQSLDPKVTSPTYEISARTDTGRNTKITKEEPNNSPKQFSQPDYERDSVATDKNSGRNDLETVLPSETQSSKKIFILSTLASSTGGEGNDEVEDERQKEIEESEGQSRKKDTIENQAVILPFSDVNGTRSRETTNVSTTEDVNQRSEIVNSKQLFELWNGRRKVIAEELKKRSSKEKSANETKEKQKFVESKPEAPADGTERENVVFLVLGIVFGQLVIVATLVGIFLYMKRRKKLKDLPDGLPQPVTAKIAMGKDKNKGNSV